MSRPHPYDLLHPCGPCLQLTSYSTDFPGYKGDNQYIKPTQKHSIGYFPFRNKTTYSQEYVKKETKKEDFAYVADQLKTGTLWLGQSTYGSFYNQPDP